MKKTAAFHPIQNNASMRVLMRWCLLAVIAAFVTSAAAQDNAANNDLYSAIRTNNMKQLQSLVAGGANVNTKGRGDVTPLMDAATAGSVDAMKFLISRGADVNAKDSAGRTALFRSATDLAKIRLLLEQGANINAASDAGRTVLMAAAMTENSAEIVRFLISKGADVKAVDTMGLNGLLAASIGNDTATIKTMVDAGLNVEAMAPKAGLPASLSPLMLAASNGNVPAIRMLLARRANVNAVSDAQSDGVVKNGPIGNGLFTPLLVAAPFGRADVVKILLDAGANVNAKDVSGMTALMRAVASDRHETTEIIRMLIDKGADVNAKSRADETALDWARKVAWPDAIALLTKAGAVAGTAPRVTPPAAAPTELRPALDRSIALMERTSGNFFNSGGCIACHAQNMTDMLVGSALAKGVRVNDAAAANAAKLVTGALALFQSGMTERLEPPIPDISMYTMAAFEASKLPPDRNSDIVVANLAAHQSSDGSWNVAYLKRPPMMEGDFTRTALIARTLKTSGAPGRRAEWTSRLAKAKRWLQSARPVTAEDRNMQLLGLVWLGADSSVTKKLSQAIIARQQPDGGWKQQDGLASDAYATGQTLYALATAAGMPTGEPVFKKGIEYLLSSQRADGSWYVSSRAPKFQPYFESGFPYGHDQWISMMATGWAAMALTQAIETPKSALNVNK